MTTAATKTESNTSSNTSSSPKRPTHAVFSVRDRGPGRKAQWTEIGVGFTNRDGSLNLILEALPIDGKCTVRLIERNAESN